MAENSLAHAKWDRGCHVVWIPKPSAGSRAAGSGGRLSRQCASRRAARSRSWRGCLRRSHTYVQFEDEDWYVKLFIDDRGTPILSVMSVVWDEYNH